MIRIRNEFKELLTYLRLGFHLFTTRVTLYWGFQATIISLLFVWSLVLINLILGSFFHFSAILGSILENFTCFVIFPFISFVIFFKLFLTFEVRGFSLFWRFVANYFFSFLCLRPDFPALCGFILLRPPSNITIRILTMIFARVITASIMWWIEPIKKINKQVTVVMTRIKLSELVLKMMKQRWNIMG